MSEKTLKFGNNVVNKREFLASKQAITLYFVDTDKIVIFRRFKHNDNGSKYFTGYKEDSIIRPLCIILPQMSGNVKYFDDGGKECPLKLKIMTYFLEYNKIWSEIKKTLNIKVHSQPIYDEKYIKTKVKAFIDVINTVFSDNEIPKQRNHYICITAILILS